MPTVTTARSTAPAPDLSTLSHLHGHPEVAAVLHKQHALRERVTGIESAMQDLRREIRTLEATEVTRVAEMAGDWAPSRALQMARQKLAGLEDEQQILQGGLCLTHQQLEAVKDAAREELRPGLQNEGHRVMQQVIDAMDALLAAQDAAQAFAQKSQHLLGTPMVPIGLLMDHGFGFVMDHGLRARLQALRQYITTHFTWTSED